MKVDGSLTILSKDKSLDTTIVVATVADHLLIPTIVSATNVRQLFRLWIACAGIVGINLWCKISNPLLL